MSAASPEKPARGDGAGLPGLRGVDHIGIVVPDLDQAIEFFAGVIGWEFFYTHGPYQDGVTDRMTVNFGMHPRTVVERIAMLRAANVNIELFQVSNPEPLPRPLRGMSDVGTMKIALYVDDMDTAVDYLRASGIEVYGEKKPMHGLESGQDATFVYFKTPWGAPMELISYPHGRAYEQTTDRRLWNPVAPDWPSGERVGPP